jgi:hypothetical protein
MACKKCGSTHQQEFPSEQTFAFPGKERLNLSPVYVCQKTLVCLDCGYAEVFIPPPQLRELREGIAAAGHSESGDRRKIKS